LSPLLLSTNMGSSFNPWCLAVSNAFKAHSCRLTCSSNSNCSQSRCLDYFCCNWTDVVCPSSISDVGANCKQINGSQSSRSKVLCTIFREASSKSPRHFIIRPLETTQVLLLLSVTFHPRVCRPKDASNPYIVPCNTYLGIVDTQQFPLSWYAMFYTIP
jgi:hypothetical protein